MFWGTEPTPKNSKQPGHGQTVGFEDILARRMTSLASIRPSPYLGSGGAEQGGDLGVAHVFGSVERGREV